MSKDTLRRRLLNHPAIIILLFEDAGLHIEMLKRQVIASVCELGEALDCVREIVDILHRNGF